VLEFSEVPLATASIGQVHVATTTEGMKVCSRESEGGRGREGGRKGEREQERERERASERERETVKIQYPGVADMRLVQCTLVSSKCFCWKGLRGIVQGQPGPVSLK
jgi:predicted unusual protein kinase regulating ubiquinone biosynthesis (AarF/ABC1/UbiB family)